MKVLRIALRWISFNGSRVSLCGRRAGQSCRI